MKCPLCGSDIAAGSKYCPICGADVEAAAQRARQAAQTQAMPRQSQQQAPRQQASRPQASQQRRAVPMNSSMPPQQPQNLRSFDTSQMSGTPKWPIVLIVVLALVIVIALVLIFVKPWQSSEPETRQIPSSAVSSVTDSSASASSAVEATPATSEPAASAEPAAAPSALSDADAYAQLTASYDQLDGFHQQISQIASEYGNVLGGAIDDMKAVYNNASNLQTEIQTASNSLSNIALADDSAYTSTKDAIANLYYDLMKRISVITEASQDIVNGNGDDASMNAASEVLGKDNDGTGTNIYKLDYEQNYEAARPVQVG